MPRWYLKRDGVKETFELIKDYHFVVPSSIDKKKCSNFADYDKISVIMTPGPHFVLGAKPLDNSTAQDCPFLAFDSNNFYGTKTMFLIDKGNDNCGAFNLDPKFSLGSSKLENIFNAFNATDPLKQNEFDVEESNRFHFTQAICRQLGLLESEGLLKFVVENAVKD